MNLLKDTIVAKAFISETFCFVLGNWKYHEKMKGWEASQFSAKQRHFNYAQKCHTSRLTNAKILTNFATICEESCWCKPA